MPDTVRKPVSVHVQAHRRRLVAAGGQEVLFQLPRTTVEMLDEFKQRHGLRSRSQALLQLIEKGRAAAQ